VSDVRGDSFGRRQDLSILSIRVSPRLMMTTSRISRSKADEGHSARLTASFCSPLSNPNPDGTVVPNIKVGGWQMPWNAKPDAGRLAPGIPPSNFWASEPNGINQVGCVYTARGFEFDSVSVICGHDLRGDPATNDWIGDPERVTRLHRQALRRPLHRPRQAHLPHLCTSRTKRPELASDEGN
jgi:DUF2075 family protein